MIDLYFWPSPNGYKPLIALEEFGCEYCLVPVNIFRGDQFSNDFVAISQNRRIPAIVDHRPPGAGSAPVSMFESGAILLYLAERDGLLASSSATERHEVLQWLFWQIGGLGPMMGQASHFINYAPEPVPYGQKRYVDETRRLFGVLENRLRDRDYLAGAYSIADMAAFPWVRLHDIVGIELNAAFPALNDWVARIASRPSVTRAYNVGEPIKGSQVMDERARPYLFGTHPPM